MSPFHRLRRWAAEDPARAAIWVMAAFLVYSLVPQFLSPRDGGTAVLDYLAPDVLPGVVIWQWFHSMAALALVGAFGWWRWTGLTGATDRAGLRFSIWVLGPMAAIYLMTALYGASLPQGDLGAQIQLILILNLGIGLTEEILFRGILFHGLRSRRTLWHAIVQSSVIFGLFHGLNVLYGQDPLLTLYQVAFATCIGVLLCGLRLQSNSLWLPIGLHMVWNSYIMTSYVINVAEYGSENVPTAGEALGWMGVVVPLFMLWLGCIAIGRWHRRTSAVT